MWAHRGVFAVVLALFAATPSLAAEPWKVGADPANAPWEFKDAAGHFRGFEVDLVKDIARRLSTTVEFEDFVSQALFPSVRSGQIDMAIASLTIRPERLSGEAFTQPYYDADSAVVAEQDAPIDSLADLKGKAVGVIAASSGETWLTRNSTSVGAAEVTAYNTLDGMMADIKAGRIAGGIDEVAGLQYAIRTSPECRIAMRIPTGQQYGILLKTDSPLLQPVNEAISAMKKDGMLGAIHKKWFRITARPGSATVTVLPLPAE